MKKYALMLFLLCLNGLINAQSKDYNYYYWFDNVPSSLQQAKISIEKWHFEPDVSWMDESLHSINIIVQDAEGRQSQPISRIFMYSKVLFSATSVNYWFDDNIDSYSNANIESGSFDIDASLLSNGLHSLTFIAKTQDGVVTKPVTRFFIKTPLGGNEITLCQYWLNDNNTDIININISEKKDPLQLIELLPVESCPFRSSQFHFEVRDGQPMAFAKNTIHFRFYDITERFSDVSKDFIDYKVGEQLNDIMSIRNNQIIAQPSENSIKWFSLQAEGGDRLEFMTDKPCTLQLFAPSNEEVYNANGPSSVSFGGVNITETGTYYLALHDVISSNSSEIALSYRHLDKFSVQTYSVKEMGVLPTPHVFSITGNGLDNVPYVLLRNNSQTIVSDTIIANNKAEAKVLFVFKGNEQFGNYDLVFHFDDGKSTKDIVINDAMKLTPPRFGNIDISFDDPRIMGSPYPISILLKNNSNLTYSEIPFYMAYDPMEKIDLMTYENFYIDVDSEVVANGLKDSYVIENFNNKEKNARLITACIPYLEAGESHTYTLATTAEDGVNFSIYAWIGTPWNLYASETLESLENFAAQYGEVVLPGTCSIDSAENHVTAGYISSPLSFYSLNEQNNNVKLSNNITRFSTKKMVFYVLNDIAKTLLELLKKTKKYYYNGYVDSYISNNNLSNGSSGLCMNNPGKYFGAGDGLDSPISSKNGIMPFPQELCDIVNDVSKAVQNVVSSTIFKKNVPRNMSEHRTSQWNPGDPNDIHGYIAPSGSKAVGKGIKEGYYIIEFENDPKIANATAHTIIIRDTLDNNVFELNSFEPTGIKLGNVLTKINKDTKFPLTIDLRPAINVIAQVFLNYNNKTGIAEWVISSLDPMTLEETTDAMQGVLPVNVNGNGQGEVTFNIQFLEELSHGCEISNNAGIIFDHEDVIMTPMWINTVDTIAPKSEITSCNVNGREISLEWTGEDSGSGIWCYDIYAKTETDSLWHLVREGVESESSKFTLIEESNLKFCTIAIDMAGNRESKLTEDVIIYDESIIETSGINMPIPGAKKTGILYDLSGKRATGRRAGVYVKDGRLQLIVR
jgi:hypothetical protein